jgi:CRISPR-associated protein Cmr6
MSKWKNYKAPNMGLLFYKHLYKDVRDKDGNMLIKIEQEGESQKIKFEVNKKTSEFIDFYNDLYAKKIGNYKTQLNTFTLGNTNFQLFTTYPGLLVGSGYSHETKSTGDASIGFYFDYTTGLPCIPGSSVKGVLKSMFENKTDITNGEALANLHFILDEIIEAGKEPAFWQAFKASLSVEKIQALKIEIFGDDDNDGKDVFFDAAIDKSKLKDIKFMDSDFITVHFKNILQNPTPIQFLKVLPSIAFSFNFKLYDNYYNNALVLDIKHKEILFKQILLTIGIGAKTNVGYGQFKESNT